MRYGKTSTTNTQLFLFVVVYVCVRARSFPTNNMDAAIASRTSFTAIIGRQLSECDAHFFPRLVRFFAPRILFFFFFFFFDSLVFPLLVYRC